MKNTGSWNNLGARAGRSICSLERGVTVAGVRTPRDTKTRGTNCTLGLREKLRRPVDPLRKRYTTQTRRAVPPVQDFWELWLAYQATPYWVCESVCRLRPYEDIRHHADIRTNMKTKYRKSKGRWLRGTRGDMIDQR